MGRWTHVGFLLGAGVVSSVLVGAWTPALVAAAFGLVSAVVVREPRAPPAVEGQVPRALLDEVADADRSRVYQLEAVRTSIATLIRERDAEAVELWAPELRRVDDAVLGFARLARRRARNRAFLREGAPPELEQAQEHVERELVEIEQALIGLRDRLAAAPSEPADTTLDDLRSRVETLERTEAEIRQLSAGFR
jgi:hypothetical protein